MSGTPLLRKAFHRAVRSKAVWCQGRLH